MDTKRFDTLEFQQEFHYDGPLGVSCGPEGTVFRLWAPTAQEVALHLYDNGIFGGLLETVLLPRGAKGVWTYETKRNLDGVYYDYDVTVDGIRRRTADPYACACGLNGHRSMVLDLKRTDPRGWKEDRAPARGPESVIYEIHVKDFSWDAASGVEPRYRGKYLGLCQTGTTLRADGAHPTGIDYLKRLGVTHVQLMPVFDYGSVDEAGDPDAFNWGYDPVNYNIPEGSYATDPIHGEVRIRELKQAIQSLHRNGFRVIMDVVYNHTYQLQSCLWKTAPWYHYRQLPDGKESNGSGCGSEIASERSMTARYILDSVLYWVEEYHMDGFRFDLMGMLDVPLLNRIQAELDRRYGKGEKLLYGEPWAGGQTSERPGTVLCRKENMSQLDEQIGAFCDSSRDAIKGSLMSPDARGFVNGAGMNALWLAQCLKGWKNEPFLAPSQTITYLSSHDDWTLWDKLVYTLDPARDFGGRQPEILKINRLAAAMNFCCQGRPFLLSGEEFARTKQGIRDTYKTPLPINRLDWNRAWENQELADYYRGLIALRKQLPGLCDKSPDAWKRMLQVLDPRPGCAAYLIDNTGGSPWAQLCLIFHCGDVPVELKLPEGTWQLLADGESTFRWQEPCKPQKMIKLQPKTAAILGLLDLHQNG